MNLGHRYWASKALCAFLLLSWTILIAEPTSDALAQSRVTSQVSVIGANRVTPKTILSYADLPEVPEPVDLNAAVRRLHSTGLFRDVTIQRSPDGVVITVAEHPPVREVLFEGNFALDDFQLEAIIATHPLGPASPTTLETDVGHLAEAYRRIGHYSAEIKARFEQLEDGSKTAIFNIFEGSVTGVRQISFVGNKVFDECMLKSVIETNDGALGPSPESVRRLADDFDIPVYLAGVFAYIFEEFAPGHSYDPDKLELDKELLRDHYLSSGYADFTVHSAIAELLKDRSGFIITFSLSEGGKYTFGDLKIESPFTFDPEFIQSLGLAMLEGQVYAPEKVEAIVDALMTEMMRSPGQQFFQVLPRASRDRDSRTISVMFELVEGPRVFIERIEIEGNVRTYDWFLRNQFEIVEGDPFNARALRAAGDRIRDLDLFSRVDLRTEQGSYDDRAIVKLIVEEQSTGALSFGVGYSIGLGPVFQVALYERNFYGAGVSGSVGVTVSPISLSAGATLGVPDFAERGVNQRWGISFNSGDGSDLLTPLAGFELVFWAGAYQIHLPLILLLIFNAAFYCHLWAHDESRQRRRIRRTVRRVRTLLILQASVFVVGIASATVTTTVDTVFEKPEAIYCA
ncbi:MAG: outer membrane protein assembly factor BamA [Pseudomonadota bacterium]